MKKNMGTLDRWIRVAVAALIAILYFTQVISGTVAMVLLIVGGIFVFTSASAFCPIYALTGLSTCSIDKGTES